MNNLSIKITAYMLFLVCQPFVYAKQVVTNPDWNVGFGSQFQNIIYAVIYAELHDMEFVYTPFKSMEQNYTGNPDDPDFLARKERLINFKSSFPIDYKLSVERLSVNRVMPFFESNLAACVQSNALKKIKKVFRANKNIRDYFDADHMHIAVHIRRPNQHDNRLAGADTPDEVFLNVINKLRGYYKLLQPVFHIYSEGKRSNFRKFDAPDTVFHVNESIEDTFTGLVLADALVTSASSFSYTAGILSEGTVYYMPFWHPPLPGWISIATL